MSNVQQFDTRPVVENEWEIAVESPLSCSLHHSGAPQAKGDSQVILRERPFLGHLMLRGGAIVLDEALREVVGLSLPGEPLGLVQSLSGGPVGECSLQWLSPDEWLLIVPGGEEFDVERRLREALGDAHISIVNVSGGQTLLELEGDKAREVLKKSVAYDVYPRHFPVGKGVTTVFAKASVILRRPSDTRWELVVRRSFADYIYRWLLDAGEEYGIAVEEGA
ncbi:sarcosine oxidase subunit gamma family protein [Halomonas sp. YLGW01]|uniref:sarcosine oxidase subunit gamma n=1 Tax=Halomonas sp. YLGW01 TaxID=2773308 RepID=UPI0017812424|nr:sarcosine oxidase subunit gamma family protein [Halomonas sp. YLGW01]